ncbi:hypothetical protein ACIQF6_30975 [Kitasatospora sp. NPDC092948]|uniref:hypothetical protein n=1 Tax=Kitasatospora sp. NPDC092948 TaxID=3364088 RepID=UPI003817BD82
MHDTTKQSAAQWPTAPRSSVDWLAELCQDDGLTGFPAPAMPDAVWVLNAMYQHDDGPGRANPEDAEPPSELPGLPGVPTVGVGGGLGRADHPGPGWRRLRWAELAERVGDPVVPEGIPPCYRCFPSVTDNGGRPTGIAWPTEGSLDRDTWNRLIAVLTAHSPAGPDTPCLAYYNPMTLGLDDFKTQHVVTARLGDALALFDYPEAEFTPANFWPQDRSWLLWTDYDLWATKVVGPTALIEAVLTDPELEALRLPWHH